MDWIFTIVPQELPEQLASRGEVTGQIGGEGRPLVPSRIDETPFPRETGRNRFDHVVLEPLEEQARTRRTTRVALASGSTGPPINTRDRGWSGLSVAIRAVAASAATAPWHTATTLSSGPSCRIMAMT